MSTLSKLPPKLARNLNVQKTANALDSARARNRGLSEQVKAATNPIRTTAAIQSGAAFAGVLLTVRDDPSTAVVPAVAIGAIGWYAGSVDAVNFANGVLAVPTAIKAGEAFSNWRNKGAETPAPEPAVAAA